MNYLEKYNEWLNDPAIDEETKKELRSIKEDESEIQDRFYKDLEFGTAGLRGVIGNGSNRMNKYTVTKATQGLANYIKMHNPENKGVAISYDSRHMSKEFSEFTALCLNANGIKTYVFESLRPVPELSFAVRQLKCIAGVMITASHNPPKYNGYKVYWEDGAQIVAPHDKGIITEVNNIKEFSEIKTMSKDKAEKADLYHVIGKEIDDEYIKTLKNLVLNLDTIKRVQKDVKIVYTPLHGAGNMPVQRILKELGFDDLLGGISLIDVLRRPGVEFNKMREYIPELTQFDLSEIGISQLEIMVKYEGYIEKQKKEAQEDPPLKLQCPKNGKYYSFQEIQAFYGISRPTLDSWVLKEGIPTMKLGRVKRIQKDAFDEVLKSKRKVEEDV